jgi:hypothetical protein
VGFEAEGLFSGLFDFHFTKFISLKFIRVIYALQVAAVLLVGLLFLISSFKAGGVGIAIGIFVVPLSTLLSLLWARIVTEVLALFFRIGENTAAMAAALERSVQRS